MATQYNVILRAINDNQEKFDLELTNTPQFLLDISAIQSDDIGKVYGISSQEFALPGTDINNRFFNNLFDLGTTPAIGLTHTVPCQVLVDGEAVYTGKLYINNIVTDQYNDVIYNCAVVNETVDFRTQIDTRALSDLNWSAYNHTSSWTAISQSWNDQLLNGDILYPLVHYGKDPNYSASANIEFGGGTFQIDNINYPLRPQDLKPAIRAKAVLDTIFNTVNYKYTSSFLNSAYFNSVYLLTTANEFKGPAINNYVSQSLYAYRATTTQSVAMDGTYYPVEYNAEVYDNGGNYDSGLYKYTADLTGAYTINVSIPFDINNYGTTDPTRTIGIRVRKNGIITLQSYTKRIPNIRSGTINLGPFQATLAQADFIQVEIFGDGFSSLETIGIRTSTNTWFKVIGPPSTELGIVNMGLQFPDDLKVLDFIQSLVYKYNLVIEPVKNERNLLKIEPFNTWVDQGIVVDWTNKVDRNVKWEITHPLGDQPKEILFTDETDEDVLNKYQNTTFDNTYGEYTYYSDSDLTNGTKTIKTIFAATPVKGIQNGYTTVIPQIYKKEENKYGQPFKFKPRLLHKQSLKTVPATEAYGVSGSARGYYYVKNDAGNTIPINYYRTLGGLTESPANFSSSYDIHFDNLDFYPYQQNYVNGRVNNDAFATYWAYYINELYDVDTRLVTMNIVLNPTEIESIQLNNKIFIDGHYYRINKIQGANLVDKQSTKVELLKTLPRKLQFPRRRIYTDPQTYTDVIQNNFNENGTTTYSYFVSDLPVTSSELLVQASLRDDNQVYGTEVIWDQTKPFIFNPNVTVIGNADYDETSNNIISVGNNGTIPQDTQDVALFFPTYQLDTYNTGTLYAGNTIVQNSAQFTGSVDITGSLCVNGDCWPFGGGSGSAASASYISVYDSTDQTLDGALTASVMTFNNTDFYNGITLVSSSRFTVSQSGVYNLEFSAQFDKTNSSNSTAYIWLKKNGTAVSQSNTSVTLGGGANDRVVAAWNWYVSASANDYYEIEWTADDDNTYLQAVNAVPGIYPAIPSVIATMGSVDKAGSQGPAGPSGSVDTGSLLTTASFNNATITFTKGDGSTFSGTVNNVSQSNVANFDVAGTIFHPPTATFSVTDSDSFTIKQIPISQSGLNVVNVNITSSDTYVKIQPIVYVNNFSGSVYTDTQIQFRNAQNNSVSIASVPYYSSSVPYYYGSLSGLGNGFSLSPYGRATDVNGLGSIVTDYEGTVYVGIGSSNEETTYTYVTSSIGNLYPTSQVVGVGEFYWDAGWISTIITGSQWLNVAGNTNFYLTSSVNYNWVTSSLPYYVQLSGSGASNDLSGGSATSQNYSTLCFFNTSGSGTIFSSGAQNNSASIHCYLSASNIYVDATSSIGVSASILVTSSYIDNTWGCVSCCFNTLYTVDNPWNIKAWYNGQPVSSASFSPTSSTYLNYISKRIVGSKLDGTNTPTSMKVGQFYSYYDTALRSDLANYQQFEFINNIYNYGL
jgi:hypothetical protein